MNRALVLYLGFEKIKQLSKVAGAAKVDKTLAVMRNVEIF